MKGKVYNTMYYIVKGRFGAKFGVYPMVILWVCYGYPMEKSADRQLKRSTIYLSRRRPLLPKAEGRSGLLYGEGSVGSR